MKLTTFFLPPNKQLLMQLDKDCSNKLSIYFERLFIEINSYLNIPRNELCTTLGIYGLYKTLTPTINKILLDNMFRYLFNKDTNKLLGIVANDQLAKDIFINPFYINELFSIISHSIPIHTEDQYGVMNIIRKYLYTFINEIYDNNPSLYNTLLCDLYMAIENILGRLHVTYYKVELGHRGMIILIYQEGDICAINSN